MRRFVMKGIRSCYLTLTVKAFCFYIIKLQILVYIRDFCYNYINENLKYSLLWISVVLL